MARKETGGNIGKALFPTPPPFPNRRGQFSLPRWIIRGLTRDGDIMDVAFRKARIGDLDEASSLLQILNGAGAGVAHRSEEHTSELQSLMRISYAVFCLKKKKLLHHSSTISFSFIISIYSSF